MLKLSDFNLEYKDVRKKYCVDCFSCASCLWTTFDKGVCTVRYNLVCDDGSKMQTKMTKKPCDNHIECEHSSKRFRKV